MALFTLLLAFAITVGLTPLFIKMMKKKQLGQTTLDVGPNWHKAKTGTPTMGGTVFLFAAIVTMILIGIIAQQFTVRLVSGIAVLLFFGAVGFADDFIKIFKKQNEGLIEKQKFIAQLVGSGLFVCLFAFSKQAPVIWLPLFGNINHFVLFAIFTIFWITGFSNAVNLTDGLDGLAATTNIVAYGAYAILAYREQAFDLAIICVSVVGALVGFLCFNHKPAKIFMGDVGSLALGAGLAVLSIMLHHEWSLLFIGIVFVCETASVILQVTSFKLTKKRIFKMSPIHHHFELSGWSEKKVVAIFSFVGIVASGLALFCIG